MKKIIPLILILIAFCGCSDDVKFNDPGFQAYRDGVLFRGIDMKAYIYPNGSLKLVALAESENVELAVAKSGVGTYYFGTTNSNTKATYASSFDDVNLLYETKVVNGPVAKMNSVMTAGGTGYTSDVNSHQTTGGSGSGLTLVITANTSGAVTSVKVASPGNGYKAGDLITIAGGGNNATVTVLNVEGSNGEVVITENTGDTVSGNFKFNAVNSNNNPLGGELVNFQHGTFYKVPVVPAP